MTPSQFFDLVRSYCYATGGSVTSYGRTAKRQEALDAKAHFSPHVVWLGADIVYDSIPSDGVERAERMGLRLLREGDHDHLQPLDWKAG